MQNFATLTDENLRMAIEHCVNNPHFKVFVAIEDIKDSDYEAFMYMTRIPGVSHVGFNTGNVFKVVFNNESEIVVGRWPNVGTLYHGILHEGFPDGYVEQLLRPFLDEYVRYNADEIEMPDTSLMRFRSSLEKNVRVRDEEIPISKALDDFLNEFNVQK